MRCRVLKNYEANGTQWLIEDGKFVQKNITRSFEGGQIQKIESFQEDEVNNDRYIVTMQDGSLLYFPRKLIEFMGDKPVNQPSPTCCPKGR